jgi:CheY-like chemotaxis protein
MKNILIIEDNAEISENTSELLELAGFNVVAARSGAEGLAMTASSKPDLILCDILMPGIDGYEVIVKLKEDPATSLIPFIYVTAIGEKNEVAKAMALGANGYLRKPFDVLELMEAIHRCENDAVG